MAHVAEVPRRLPLFYVVDSMAQNATRELQKEGLPEAKAEGLRAVIAVRFLGRPGRPASPRARRSSVR